MQQLPAGQGSRDRHATIHTHHAAITGPRDGVGDHSKSDVPAPRPIQSDAVRLHGVGDGAGPPELHPADLGYPYLSVAAVEPCDVAWFDGYLSESFVLAGFAPRRTTMGTVKEKAHRLGEVPQRLLLHSLRPCRQPVVFRARRGQLGALLFEGGRLATWLPVPLLLHGKIPHKPGMTTVLDQYCRLLDTGKQPKPAHINNLGSTTDNKPERREAVFPPPAKARDFHAADLMSGELARLLQGAVGDPLTVANEFAEVQVRRVDTRNGSRLLISAPRTGQWISLDALEVEALTRQNTRTLTAMVGNSYGPLLPDEPGEEP
jgi:hypothetical protein